MSPQKAVSLVFVASVLLVVVSYGIWQFGKILSPSQQFSADPVVSLSISDYYEDGSFNPLPLPNNLTDTTVPVYGDKVLMLNYNDQQLNMARLQGTIDYR
jgi:hypothetical protein